MPWFRVDDSLDTHPKAIAAGNEALGLWVRCGAYAARHLTDGFIPEEIALLYGSRELADALVRSKLWRRTKGGYRMHDYLDRNPSREAVENQRAVTAQRQARWRQNHAGKKSREPPVDNGAEPQSSTSDDRGRRLRNAVTNGVSHSAPSHPVVNPLTPVPDGTGEHGGQHKHCRACGTNRRGKPAPTPQPPPVADAIAAALRGDP